MKPGDGFYLEDRITGGRTGEITAVTDDFVIYRLHGDTTESVATLAAFAARTTIEPDVP